MTMAQMLSLKEYSGIELEELYQVLKYDIDRKFGSASTKINYRLSIGIDYVRKYPGYVNSFNELGIPPHDNVSRVLEVIKGYGLHDSKLIGPYKDHLVTIVLSLDISQVPLYINSSLSRVRLTAKWRLSKGK